MHRNSSLARLLLCALLAVLVCAAPLGGLAEPEPTSPVIGVDHPTAPGEVMLFKEAKPVPGMVNTWDITVRIEAWDKPVASDIILVIDRSGSMAGSRMTNAKIAANAFVDTLLDGTHPGVRIGVASFAGDASIDQSLTDNAAALKATINSLSATGGTHTQAGMRTGAGMLAGSTATYKNIVLLSDGQPTYSYALNNPGNYLQTYGTSFETNTSAPSSEYNSSVRVGTGSDLRQRINAYTESPLGVYRYNNTGRLIYRRAGTTGGYTFVAYNNSYFEYNPAYNYYTRQSDTYTQVYPENWTHYVSSFYYNNGNSAIAEAGYYKSEDDQKYLYTIAFEVDDVGEQVLENMASAGKAYTATQASLAQIFATIAGEISAIVKNSSITDVMGTGFTIPNTTHFGSDPATPAPVYNEATGQVTWNSGDLTKPVPEGQGPEGSYPYLKYAELYYRVEIDDNILNADSENGLYKTNASASISYHDVDGNTVTKNFPSPSVNPVLYKLEKVLKDAFGNVISSASDPWKRAFTLNVKDRAPSTDLDHYNKNYVLKPDAPRVLTSLRVDQTYDVEETLVTNNYVESSLDLYNTTIQITNPDSGELEERTSFVISGDTTPDAYVLVTNQEKPAKLTVYKVFTPGEGAPAGTVNTLEYTFALTMDDPIPGFTQETFTLKAGESEVFDQLAHGTYRITETESHGFTVSYQSSSETTDGTVILAPDKQDKTVTVTNTPDESTTAVVAYKEWVNGNSSKYAEWSTIDLLKLKQNSNAYGPAADTVTVDETNPSRYVYTWNVVPKYDSYGNELDYTVYEPSAPAGFTQSTDPAKPMTIINTYTPATGTGTIPGTKTLTGRDIKDGEFTFKLMDGTTEVTTATNTGSSFTIQLPTYKWDPLRTVDETNVVYLTSNPQVFNYTLVEDTSALPDGVSHTPATFNVKVKVTYTLGSGTLAVVVTDDADAALTVAFANTYTPATGTGTIPGTKTLTGRDIEDNEFTFKLMNGTTEVATATNTGNNFTIQLPTYKYDPDRTEDEADVVYLTTNPQVFTYTLVEDTSALPAGVSHTPAVFNVEVTLTHTLGESELDVTVTITDEQGEEKAVAFTNTYAATGSLTLTGSKKMTGRALLADEFTFELYDGTIEEGETPLQTVKNVAAANGVAAPFSFTALDYTLADVGSKTYTVIEKQTAVAGVTLDTTSYEVTVTIADKGDSTLIITPSTNYNALNFTNIYEAEGEYPITGDTDISLNPTKMLTGRTLTADAFTFQLKKGGVLVEEVKNLANGSIPFSNLKYDQTQVGEHSYTIEEVEPSPAEAGMSYDKTTLSFTVVVTDEGGGVLKAVLKAMPADTEFNNSYKAEGEYPITGDTDISLNPTKVLTGRDLKSEEFSFELILDGAVLQTVKNDASGSIPFTALSFTEADIGKTYAYTIKEVKPATPETGMSYDAMELAFSILVEDAGEGELKLTVTKPEDVVFNNALEDPAVAEVLLTLQKKLVGQTLVDNAYTFELLDLDNTVLQTVQNRADGTVTFNPIHFVAPGTDFVLKVREAKGHAIGVTYDGSVYTLHYDVTLQPDNTLQADLVKVKKNGATISADSSLVFKNIYEEPVPPTPTYPKLEVPLTAKKVLGNGTLQAGSFSFQLKDSAGKVLATVSNFADGAIVFPARTFTKAVTNYKYTVHEVAGEDSSIIYDPTIYTVLVSTNPVGGELEATVSILKNGTPYAGEMEFMNQRKAPPTGDAIDSTLIILIGSAVLLIAFSMLIKRRRSNVA